MPGFAKSRKHNEELSDKFVFIYWWKCSIYPTIRIDFFLIIGWFFLARDTGRKHHHHLLSSEALENNFNLVNYILPKNTRRKNAVCYSLTKDIILHEINELAIYGGVIGPGNSGLDKFLNRFKLFRLHDIFHDAFGFMKSNFDVGPGYVYALSWKPVFVNSMLLGHLTGFVYWFLLKLFSNKEYRKYSF